MLKNVSVNVFIAYNDYFTLVAASGCSKTLLEVDPVTSSDGLFFLIKKFMCICVCVSTNFYNTLCFFNLFHLPFPHF